MYYLLIISIVMSFGGKTGRFVACYKFGIQDNYLDSENLYEKPESKGTHQDYVIPGTETTFVTTDNIPVGTQRNDVKDALKHIFGDNPNALFTTVADLEYPTTDDNNPIRDLNTEPYTLPFLKNRRKNKGKLLLTTTPKDSNLIDKNEEETGDMYYTEEIRPLLNLNDDNYNTDIAKDLGLKILVDYPELVEEEPGIGNKKPKLLRIKGGVPIKHDYDTDSVKMENEFRNKLIQEIEKSTKDTIIIDEDKKLKEYQNKSGNVSNISKDDIVTRINSVITDTTKRTYKYYEKDSGEYIPGFNDDGNVISKLAKIVETSSIKEEEDETRKAKFEKELMAPNRLTEPAHKQKQDRYKPTEDDEIEEDGNKLKQRYRDDDVKNNEEDYPREGRTLETTTDTNTDTDEDYGTTDNRTFDFETPTILHKKTTTKQFDIPALLEIIANLTYEYDTNLTNMLNESLQRWSLPTCAPGEVETTTSNETVYDYWENGTGTVMGKCFVCGLEEEYIPFRSHCGDAFGSDFLSITPVDPAARGQLSNFRKYCRYMDIIGTHVNDSDPKSLWGRWTGGCGVRWMDLSGLYTQRVCRNRGRAVVGRHFLSKRMAKLEMALKHVEDGCVISPAASLVPMSRGINVYARFHACVCSHSWCNLGVVTRPSVIVLLIVACGLS